MAWEQLTLSVFEEFAEVQSRFFDATGREAAAMSERQARLREYRRRWREKQPRRVRVARGRDPLALKAARDRWRAKTRTAAPRVRVGVDLPHAKLDEDAVRSLRAAWRGGESVRSIAKRTGLAYGTVHPMLTGRTWRHVRDAVAA